MPEGAQGSGQECKVLSVIFLVPHDIQVGEGQGKHQLPLSTDSTRIQYPLAVMSHIFIAQKF